VRFLGQALRHPVAFARTLWVGSWSRRTVVALVMQTRDGSLTTSWRRGLLGSGRLTSTPGQGEANPSWIPLAHTAVRQLAVRVQEASGVRARPGGTVADVLDVPMTAHFLGGCPIGASPEDSVLDTSQQVHGHPGLHVVDGAAVSANLGVNPSLTITAQAERVFSGWPPRVRSEAVPSVITQRNPTSPLGEQGPPDGAASPRHGPRSTSLP
jgi:cholesterol oxidase